MTKLEIPLFSSHHDLADEDIQVCIEALGLEEVLYQIGFDKEHWFGETNNFYEIMECKHKTRSGKVVEHCIGEGPGPRRRARAHTPRATRSAPAAGSRAPSGRRSGHCQARAPDLASATATTAAPPRRLLAAQLTGGDGGVVGVVDPLSIWHRPRLRRSKHSGRQNQGVCS